MFEPFFGLSENPFSMSPDPKFLLATPTHRESIAGLVYGLTERLGLMVLTGAAGTGKTTVLRVVADALPQDVQFSYVLNPTLTPDELLEHTLLDLGVADVPASKAQRMFVLGELLSRRHEEDKVSALIIDEAHGLSAEVLEEVRLLMNFESDTQKMLQIVLVGQPQFGDLLNLPELQQLKQRISLRLKIKPLTGAEVVEYVGYRWKRADGRDEPPFTTDAVSQVALYSQGVPRLVNSICQNALMLAFAADRTTVGSDEVRQAVEDLELLVAEEAAVENQVSAEPLPFSGDDVEGPTLPTLERYSSGAAKASGKRRGIFGRRRAIAADPR